MNQPSTEYLTDLEKQTSHYLGLIRRIDSILEDPVKSVIRIIGEYAVGALQFEKGKSVKATRLAFPVWLSEDVQPETDDYLFAKGLCFTTLQKISKSQRRFSWLGSEYRDLLRELMVDGHERLVESLIPKSKSFGGYIRNLKSRTFGTLNPLTSAQIFNVLLNAGEARAHGERGFLAFFAMIWPLKRTFPDRHSFGAFIEPWQPKAYVTARCILPIKTLQEVCSERASLLEAFAANLEKLDRLAKLDGEAEPNHRWEFSVELDDLSANLSRLSRLTIEKDPLFKCAERVEELAATTNQSSDNKKIFAEVLEKVVEAVGMVGKAGVKILGERGAGRIIKQIENNLIVPLRRAAEGDDLKDLEYLRKKMGLKFAWEYLRSSNPDNRRTYLEDLVASAEKSLAFCNGALTELIEACEVCSEVADPKQLEQINAALRKLAKSNREIARRMGQLVGDATAWCRSVVDREIAYASAQNITDFDPAELVSAIAVAVRWEQLTTKLQVSDAVSKALAGARADGSWSPGQPFYSFNNASAIWPVTADIVWTLTGALQQQPDVDVADEVLFRFVDWLERTRTELKPLTGQKSSGPKELKLIRQLLDKIGEQPIVGWASDRLRHPRKIHFATTAFSINALLEIRDLVEYRLWQLCEKRFTVLKIKKGLKDIAPVDLGAQKKHRLHRHLAWMARKAQGWEYDKAEYSLLLHGPPGSSKTAIAEALSTEMWRATEKWGAKEPRLVRITPADFTRLGEDRLDSEARLIFDLISGVRAVTIFFDEIDDLLRQRDSTNAPRFMDLVVPAMLNRLADLRNACPRQEVCFLLATNFVENIEPALIRKGRIDKPVPVVYPDQESRLTIVMKFTREIKKKLYEGKVQDDTYTEICLRVASETAQWPYLTVKSACEAMVNRLKEYGEGENFTPPSKDEWESLVKAVIRENKSSFSKPDYHKRWGKRFSQELLNEYVKYRISGFRHYFDYDSYLNNPETLPGESEYKTEQLGELIRGICEDERRFLK